ncbi:MAG: Na/Pi symporter [bacterium]
MPDQSSTANAVSGSAMETAARWVGVVALVYLLLVGVSVVGEGFKWISGGAEGAAAIFAFASNPIVGVILGTLATALVQSSSTVTSVIVGLVAGGVPVSLAVPMIMGANMGTTITNTIVSLGNLRDSAAFKKSFQAATVHDFFNLFSIIIFLPIEMLFHPLERMAGVAAGWLAGGQSASMSDANFMGALTKPVAGFVVGLLRDLPDSVGASLAIGVGVLMIMLAVVYLGKLLRRAMTGRAKGVMEKAIGRRPETGVMSGTLVTVLVQSSSTTTSLIVPLAGAGVLTLKQVFPFTMGANIGTCITALLAATAVTGNFQVFALQIALVHLFYNVLGVLAFLYVPWLRHQPIRAATLLGQKSSEHRGWAFGYIFAVFFILPGAVFGTQLLTGPSDPEIIEALQSEEANLCRAELEDCAVTVE